jgi:ankyrin repeat protein
MNGARGLFWIKGNPGSGKSVLMKHAARTAAVQKPKDLVGSYFVHGQGSELQKTPVGILRALLNSLLGHFPTCLARLATIFEDREKRYGGYQSNRWRWTGKELEEAMGDILIENTGDQHVTIFVDAIDECGEGPGRTLLSYFGSLSRRAEEMEANFKICVSSRHYPVLGFDEFPSVCVEERNGKDIQWYVNDRLNSIGSGSKRQKVEEEILLKARGGFQWVFLITKTLIDRSLVGKNVLSHVASCPITLSEMYAALLETGSESDRHQMVKLFRWILFAERPLSAQELREALATDAKMTCTSVVDLRSHEDWSETLVDFERYVRPISKGLVEFHDREIWEYWEDSDREAQFIHQSVADFLTEDFAIDVYAGTTGAGHFLISRSCLNYLTLKEHLDHRQQRRDAISSKFPLGPYAVRYVFNHIKKAESAGQIQTDLLPSIRWSSHSNLMRQLAELWNKLNPHNIGTPCGWPFIGSSEHHVLAALGTKSALLPLLKSQPRARHGQDLDGNTPLHIALTEAHLEIASLLLNEYREWKHYAMMRVAYLSNEVASSAYWETRPFDLDAQNNGSDTALDIAVTTEARAVVWELLDLGATVQRMNQPYLLIFFAIAEQDEAMLAKLISEDVDLTGALYFAVENNSSHSIVIQLIKAGASPGRLGSGERDDSEDDSSDYDIDAEHIGDSALHLACHKVSAELVNLMLSNGISATILDRFGRYPIHVAVAVNDESYRKNLDDHIKLLKSLIKAGPSTVELEDNVGRSALDIASENGRKHFMKILLKRGQFSRPSTVLTRLLVVDSTFAKFLLGLGTSKSQEFVGLLDHVDLGSRDEFGRTLLWRAAAHGKATIVQLLARKGTVDFNATDITNTSPLLAAISHGFLDVVEVLLKMSGIDVNAKNEARISPLLAAADLSDDRFVKRLLDVEDIDVNIEDDRGMTPLALAAAAGQRATVEALLVRTDTDFNARDAKKASVIFTAVKAGHIDVVEALLRKETLDVNAGDESGITPITLAIRNGDTNMVRLLLKVPATSLHTQDLTGMSPIIEAVIHRCPLMLHLILSADKIRNGTGRPYRSLLRGAMRYLDTGLGQSLLLLARGIINSYGMGQHAQATLNLAILVKNEAVVKLLLSTVYFSVHTTDKNGYTALTLAVFTGNAAIVKLLVNAVVFDVNMVDGHGNSPLWTAILHGHRDIVKLLLNTTRIDVNILPGKERLPSILWWTARQPDKTVFKMLLTSDQVDIGVTGDDEESLLLWAIRNDDKEVLRLLLDTAKVDVNQANRYGVCPMSYAKRHGITDVLELLETYSLRV